MKRYGYTFVKPDGENTSFAELRFFATLFAFLGMIFSKVFSGELLEGVYIFYWFLYVVLGFLPELIHRLNVYPVTLTALASISLAIYILMTLSQPHQNEDLSAIVVFIAYQCSILCICGFYLFSRYRK